jgi:neurotrimin
VSLISVGKYQYSRDSRFKIIHEPHTQDWVLVIQAVKFEDAGPYECQVNTSPVMRKTIYLTVVGKEEFTRQKYLSPLC